jgi:hypothetical protein
VLYAHESKDRGEKGLIEAGGYEDRLGTDIILVLVFITTRSVP